MFSCISHIYLLYSSKYDVEHSDLVKKLPLNKTSYHQYNFNYSFKDNKYFREILIYNCIKDAFNNNYDKICFLYPDVKIINDNIENFKYYNIFCLNPKDVNNDCVILDRSVIKYIINLPKQNFSNTFWKQNIFDYLNKNFKIYYPEQNYVKHKVDYVLTYVNDKDKNWQITYKNTFNNLNYRKVRFEDYNCLEELINGINKYAAFIDNIYIVVQNTSEVSEDVRHIDNVKIIEHKEIVPQKYLPMFNSCSIEMFIGNIPNLSEYFIYGNDDMFFTNFVDETDFFIHGKIISKLNDITSSDSSMYFDVVKNSFKIFFKEFAYTYFKDKNFSKSYKKLVHTPHPIRKSACYHINNLYSNEIEKSLTLLRSNKNLNQYIYTFYEYFYDNIIDSNQFIYKYFGKDDDLKISNEQIICVNEHKDNLKSLLQQSLNKYSLNIALCAIAKNENLYIREWVEHYKNIGVSKIFLYDNNDIDGERFEEVINDYIESDFVEVIDVRGIEKGLVYDAEGINLQPKCYIDCYENKVNDFDYVCFFDIDEFLTFKDGYNLFSFLQQDCLKEADTILVPWIHYDDNDLIEYDSRPVMERFIRKSKKQWYGVKSIVKTNKKIFNKQLSNLIHNFILESKLVYFSSGKKLLLDNPDNWYTFKSDDIEKTHVELNHYKTKTISEFVKRHLKRHFGTGKHFTRKETDIFTLKNNFLKYNNLDIRKLSKLYLSLPNENKLTNNNLICSITSWKKRINLISKNIENILNNSVKPFKVILTLSLDEFPNKEKDLPNDILILSELYNNFEIFWVNGDEKCCKKMIYTINRFKEHFIVTLDDDISYPNNLIESIINEYNKYEIINPMSFGGQQSDWNINNLEFINSHYGACSITKYEYYGEYLNELYENVVKPAIKNNIKIYDDVWYTYAALLNKKLYIRNKNYSIRNYVLNSPKLPFSFSKTNNSGDQIKKCHELFTTYIFEKYNKTIYDLVNEAYDSSITVSFTTWTKRDFCVPEMLQHFTKQTLHPNRIILWLSEQEYDRNNLPQHLIKCLNDRLLDGIRFVKYNTFGLKRYETVKTNYNGINIFIDDDILYFNDYVEQLVNNAIKYKYHIITYCGQEIEYVGTARTLKEIKKNNISAKNSYLSGLSAFAPSTFPIELFNFVNEFLQYGGKCDDSFISAFKIKNNIPHIILKNRNDNPFITIKNTQQCGLWETTNKIEINGIKRRIINFANCLTLLNIENKAKQIWPKFEINKCRGFVKKLNLSTFTPYIDKNYNIINKNLFYEYIITQSINKRKILDIYNPKLIWEKIQWLKINDISYLKTKCADKILVHDYVKEKIGEDICVPIIKIYDKPEDIDINELPDKFVIKCNHGYKMNIICNDKNSFNLEDAIKKCKTWLNTDFGSQGAEYHYSLIKPKCFAEIYLENSNGLTDYKIWCQNGIPYFIMVINDRFSNNQSYANVYDLNWNPIHLGWSSFPENFNMLDKKPKTLNKMIEYAKILSKDFKFVRVDFYEVNNKCYLGELTFTPGNGWFNFSAENDIKYGDLLKL